jgi:hypothetical protein
MSIFKYYKSTPKFDNIFTCEDVVLHRYNTYMDTLLMKWLADVHSVLFVDNDDTRDLIKSTREIFYNRIRYQHNFIQQCKLQGMLLASYLLACKFLLPLEFIPSIHQLCWFTKHAYVCDEILKMEMTLVRGNKFPLKVSERIHKAKLKKLES